MAKKSSGFGVDVEWDPAGGTAWTSLAQLRDVGGPSLSRNSIDATTHDDPNEWMTFLRGLKDGGELSLEIAWDPSESTHDAGTGLLSDMTQAGTAALAAFRANWPGTATVQWEFDGFVTGFEPTPPLDDLLTASCTVKVSGKPTLA